jgi:hypothetical protein
MDTQENDIDVENRDPSTTITTTTTSTTTTPTLEQVCTSLQALIHFLTETMLAPTGNGLMLRQECAKSIAVHYPHRRVEKAVLVYKQELVTILARLQAPSTTEIYISHNNNINSKVLFVEQHLAEFVGQAVRYNLRRFFNQAPPRLTPADTHYEQRLGAYSQVHALVAMEMYDEYENAAVDDACISALVSTALCRIYEFFGLEALLEHSSQLGSSSLPTLFCQKPASNRGFSVGSNYDTHPMTEHDMEDILDDVDEATSFLAATKGCRFLLDLFQIQGVPDEITRQGGWLVGGGDTREYQLEVRFMETVSRRCPPGGTVQLRRLFSHIRVVITRHGTASGVLRNQSRRPRQALSYYNQEQESAD